MKPRALLLPLILLAAFCAHRGGQSQSVPLPGHGAITLTITPNPIIAQPVSGTTYAFPFDAVIRETGGRAVTIHSVSINVFAFGGIPVGSESYDAARLASSGYATTVPANGELRYHFSPRKEVPDERALGSVRADVRIDGTDDAGTAVSATTSVTVRR